MAMCLVTHIHLLQATRPQIWYILLGSQMIGKRILWNLALADSLANILILDDSFFLFIILLVNLSHKPVSILLHLLKLGLLMCIPRSSSNNIGGYET
jgi:hypothetical protein